MTQMFVNWVITLIIRISRHLRAMYWIRRQPFFPIGIFLNGSNQPL
jgi:hypothetical protein